MRMIVFCPMWSGNYHVNTQAFVQDGRPWNLARHAASTDQHQLLTQTEKEVSSLTHRAQYHLTKEYEL